VGSPAAVSLAVVSPAPAGGAAGTAGIASGSGTAGGSRAELGPVLPFWPFWRASLGHARLYWGSGAAVELRRRARRRLRRLSAARREYAGDA